MRPVSMERRPANPSTATLYRQSPDTMSVLGPFGSSGLSAPDDSLLPGTPPRPRRGAGRSNAPSERPDGPARSYATRSEWPGQPGCTERGKMFTLRGRKHRAPFAYDPRPLAARVADCPRSTGGTVARAVCGKPVVLVASRENQNRDPWPVPNEPRITPHCSKPMPEGEPGD